MGNADKYLNPLTALGLVVAVLVLISQFFGGDLHTKAEWRQSVLDDHAAVITVNQIIGTKKKFTDIMGEPDKVKSRGDRVWWLYYCRDGLIEIEMSAFTGGALCGTLNED